MATKTKKKEEYPLATPEIEALNAVVPDSRHEDYTGKTVVLRKRALIPAYQVEDRRFIVSGGFGAKPNTMGSAVFGVYVVDGEDSRVERGDIEGVAVNMTEHPKMIKFTVTKVLSISAPNKAAALLRLKTTIPNILWREEEIEVAK